MDLFDIFHKTAKDTKAYARNLKQETGGKIVGFFCSYAPEEIILAAKALPYRILSAGESIQKADSHLQSYCCSQVRGALDDVLSGKLDFLDGAVFPHTCDTIQRLSDIWRLNVGLAFHADIGIPTKLNTKSAKEYMIQSIRRFKRDIEKGLGVRITEADLIKAVKTYNQLRASLQRLYEIRLIAPEIISGKDVDSILKCSMTMERNRFIQKLTNALDMLDLDNNKPEPDKKRIILAGGVCAMPDIYGIIENAGGIVVFNDMCTGNRYFEHEIELNNNQDVIESIAMRYMAKTICPAKHKGLYSRGENLVQLAKENHADGVVFVFLKFCDPHLFDYPYLKKMLNDEKIPNTMIEIQEQTQLTEQLKTRCEAFIEML